MVGTSSRSFRLVPTSWPTSAATCPTAARSHRRDRFVRLRCGRHGGGGGGRGRGAVIAEAELIEEIVADETAEAAIDAEIATDIEDVAAIEAFED